MSKIFKRPLMPFLLKRGGYMLCAKRKIFLSAWALVGALTGCTSVPKVELDSAAKKNIKSITLIGVYAPQNARVIHLGSAGHAFGPIGALVKGSIDAENTQKFLQVVNERKVPFAGTLITSLQTELEKKGFKVTYDPNKKPKLAPDRSDDYSDIQVDSDVILNVWFTVIGHVAPSLVPNYIPTVGIKARVLDSRSKKEIYFKLFTGGFAWRIENAVNIPAADKYQHGSFDALMSNFDYAIEGIMESEKAIAARIASDLSSD